MQYFNHDTSASVDDKLMALRIFHGGAAVDCYWAIVERVYKDERAFTGNRFAVASLASTLSADTETVQRWIDGIKEVGLLTETSEGLTSNRIAANIEAYRSKVEQSSKAGKASAAKRKANKVSTGVERPLNDRSTNKIKENKVDVELLKAQQSTTPNGSGEQESAAAEAFDWDAEFKDVIHSMRTANL